MDHLPPYWALLDTKKPLVLQEHFQQWQYLPCIYCDGKGTWNKTNDPQEEEFCIKCDSSGVLRERRFSLCSKT